MTRARLQSALAVLFALLGAALGMSRDLGAAAPLALALATLVAFDTPLALVLGGLAFAAGLGTLPLDAARAPMIDAFLGTALIGFALGALARAFARHLPALVQGSRRVEFAAFLAAILALGFLMPDGRAHLADAHGALLSWPATVGDPETLARAPIGLEMVVNLARPAALLTDLMVPLALLAGFLLVAFRGPRGARLASRVALIAAILAVGASLVGLAELLFMHPTLDPVAVQRAFDLRASGTGTLIALGPVPDAAFSLWSRPLVDPIRLITAICLLLTLLPLLRPAPEKSSVHQASSAARSAKSLADAALLVPPSATGATFVVLALALAMLANVFSAVPHEALAAGLFLGVGALVAGLYGTSSDRLPRYALAATGLVWIWGIALAGQVG